MTSPKLAVAILVALLAVGASAAVIMSRAWHLDSRVSVVEKTDTVSLTVSESGTSFARGIGSTNLTREEAASLGRALLEAAGQPEKVCPALAPCSMNQGCFTIQSIPVVTPTGYTEAK